MRLTLWLFFVCVFVSVLLSGCSSVTGKFLNTGSETGCVEDSDCACGTHYKTGNCFAGNKHYVNESDICPDFCNGISGNLILKCVNAQCEMVSK